jgi:uncharacterized membrane protein
MAGIAWIGTSFFFIWLEASLKKRDGQAPGIAGETWMVHGGGFYLAEKYAVAPDRLPDELHWFKYEAYFTWITGFLLLVVIYYFGAEAFLIDRDKVPLSPVWASLLSAGSLAAAWFIYNAMIRWLGGNAGWLAFWLFVEIAAFTFFYHGVFSDRAAFLHVGAMIGTIMAASVFLVIIPNQKKVVADLIAGRKPDPALGREAGQRSLHNNYLTLPVIFMMVSGHYPAMFGHPWSPFIALGIVVAGALVRHFFNVTNHGVVTWTAIASIPAAIAVAIVLIAVTAYRPELGGGLGDVAFGDVQPIIAKHCVTCHSATPTHDGITEAPKGVAFDTPEEIRLHAEMIKKQTVLSDIMPLGNETGMTSTERRMLGAWVDRGARLR